MGIVVKEDGKSMFKKQERQGIIVYLYYNRDARKLNKYGDVLYHSRKMRYQVLYVNKEEAEDIAKDSKNKADDVFNKDKWKQGTSTEANLHAFNTLEGLTKSNDLKKDINKTSAEDRKSVV